MWISGQTAFQAKGAGNIEALDGAGRRRHVLACSKSSEEMSGVV